MAFSPLVSAALLSAAPLILVCLRGLWISGCLLFFFARRLSCAAEHGIRIVELLPEVFARSSPL